MTPKQKLLLEQSEKRERVNALLGQDSLTDDERGELDSLSKRLQGIEPELRAAILADPEPEPVAADRGDPEIRERLELRAKARLGRYLELRFNGAQVDGAEAELAAAEGVPAGTIPLAVFHDEAYLARDRKHAEERAVTPAPSSGVGVNLQPIIPAVFAGAVAPSLGVEMPSVASGTFATLRISTSLTAAAEGKGDAAQSTAASFTSETTKPHRVSAMLELRAEDIAEIGTASFEPALRENLAMVLADKLDELTLRGSGASNNPEGLIGAIGSAPTAPTTTATFATFRDAFIDGIDGLWASRMGEMEMLVGPETYRLASKVYNTVGDTSKGYGEVIGSAADVLNRMTMGFRTHSRMPAKASNVQQAILCRKGRPGYRTAVQPIWNYLAIEDRYSESDKATTRWSIHALVGDVIVTQPNAYVRRSFKVS